MGRKTKRALARALDPATLKKRAELALKDGNARQAVDFARTLYGLVPEPAHRELLVQASLAEVEQCLSVHQSAPAVSMASQIWPLVETVAEKSRLAEILARCGTLNRAWVLAEQVASPTLLARVVAHAADAAIRNKLTLQDGLPADFHSHKEAILRAFAEVQAGQDEQARVTLQAIALTSPFLEWKVLLRGLLAYYQNDDAKAVENWQRLDPVRVPAQLAAPLRVSIDPAYRASLPAESRARLEEIVDSCLGSGLTARLRTVQRHLADDRKLTQAFNQAVQLLPSLKQQAPHLVARLAGCFFWAIVDHGQPDDLDRYRSVFGSPPEDPELHRLEAMALEFRESFQEAHDSWLDYEKSLADKAALLPPGQADRMRSLVWAHMGANAALVPDVSTLRRMRGSPFANLNGLPPPLHPNAESCFQHSVKLAPDQLQPHVTLLKYFVDANMHAKALQAGKRLLKQFPEHAPTLETVGELCLEKHQYAEAVNFIVRAVQANPLDTRLRWKLSAAHTAFANYHASCKDFDKARQAFAAALALCEAGKRLAILCQWAACEFRAADAGRAEELLQQARVEHGHPLAIAFAMLVQAIQLKLAKPLKTRFEGEFKELVSQTPDAASAMALATQAAFLRREGVKYTGQKTHEKKVLAFIDKAKKVEFTEGQLQELCDALVELQASKQLHGFFARGQKSFPSNPRFYLAEVDYELARPPMRIVPTRVQRLLDKIRELAGSLPAGEREGVLNLVQERDEKLRSLNPLRGFMGMPGFSDFLQDIGAIFGDEEGDFFDDDEDEFCDDGDDEWEDDF